MAGWCQCGETKICVPNRGEWSVQALISSIIHGPGGLLCFFFLFFCPPERSGCRSGGRIDVGVATMHNSATSDLQAGPSGDPS